MKIAIIFTGIITNEYIDDFICGYKDIDNNKYHKIVSTWDYTEQSIIDKLILHKFTVVLSNFPEFIPKRSANYILFSLSKGIEFVKTTNATHILQIRSDMCVNNMNKLLNIYENIYSNKPIFLGCFNHDGGYLFDYCYLFDIHFFHTFVFVWQSEDDNRFNEKYIQETYFQTSDVHCLLDMVTTSIFELVKNNIEIYCVKTKYREQTKLLTGYLQVGVFHPPKSPLFSCMRNHHQMDMVHSLYNSSV